ncbi:toll-like receptor Tollo [Caerostris darwini]|uniref:Toll-like receptor Tollo n=1 Tax=Caerostris darwini TaxID=1538125 RepID=A0AAV4TY02_9ARAC|nr:toll-like receptor Tollo [Caerostris darwini]
MKNLLCYTYHLVKQFNAIYRWIPDLKLFGSYLLCLTYLDSFLKRNIFPMGNKLKAIHLICLLCIFCNLTNAQVFAKECDVTNSDDDQVMTCRVRTLHNIAEIGKSEIDHSTFLTLFCDDLNHEILVTNGTFAKLNNLQSIRIENCNIPVFPDYSFWGLFNLGNLSIHLNKTGTKQLFFREDSFAGLQKLHSLELDRNTLIVLPPNLFCNLENLKMLNLTSCELDDARNIGMGTIETTRCVPELMVLDLSYNILKSIPDGIFSSLVSLKILYLNNNQLSELYPYAFSGLSRLQSLDLSNNRISHLPEQIFQQSNDILELYLQNNSLSSLTPRVFQGLRQLVGLNLSYNSLENVISSETLADLSRLLVLDLNHNRFQTITEANFHLIRSLQILYLSYNEIHNISDSSFSSLKNLHTLTLQGNKIRYIDINTFGGLESLNYLSLSNNNIEIIHPQAFTFCKSVQNLKLRSNKLIEFPKAIKDLIFLKHLDLTHNRIFNISNATFQGLRNIVSLHMARNKIGNMTKGCFQDLISLKTLDFSYNRIQSLGHSLFDDVPELRVAKFNDNHLTDINGLFMNLRYLHTLNVSRNNITWFDYALVPTELKTLDIHDNEIDGLGNYFELELLMTLRNLDASHNIIRELTPASLPNSIEVVSFRSNRISVIGPFTFMAKTNLSFVDLRGNAIRHLDINAFRLKSIPSNHPLPEFLLSNNTLICDCSMEWLQRINHLDESRQYPMIIDLGEVVCNVTLPRQNALVEMSVTKSSDFLCRYQSHCFALCHCCEFDACDCEMMCPENCTCYSDQTWNTNMVDCSLRGYSHVPHRVPMDVTDLYLDGNDMSHVGSHSFIGRKNLRVLHLNNSNIHVIRNRTFNGLQNLLVLHLENNHITAIEGHEFTNLTKLQELYLSHNRLKTIKNESFKHLSYLQVLYLDHNHIVDFNVWILGNNRGLTRVKLGHNKWNCVCDFTERFKNWYKRHKSIIVDEGSIRCSYNNSTTMHLIEFTNSTCSNFSIIPFTSAEFVQEYMSVMILVPMLLILILVTALVVWKYRNNMKMWIYDKYGLRLFEKNDYPVENEKLFDAFVSYCKKDEAFVTQMVAPELECGLPPQRLCLRYRDLPASRYMAETISEAVECSFCSIAVVSEQYLKSEWCLFELKACHHESQCNRRHKVIIVLLNKVDLKELDADVRACFKAALIVHWGDRRFWEKLRYALPEGRNNRHHVNCSENKLSSTLRRSSLSNSIKLV